MIWVIDIPLAYVNPPDTYRRPPCDARAVSDPSILVCVHVLEVLYLFAPRILDQLGVKRILVAVVTVVQVVEANVEELLDARWFEWR